MLKNTVRSIIPFCVAVSVLVVPGTIALVGGCDAGAGRSTTNRSLGTVPLEIDFGEKKQTISVDVPVSADSTVLQIMERARNMGDLDFKSSGSGETAMILSINGVENEGANGNNWIYRVNGKVASKGCGVYAVQKGDKIRWAWEGYP